MSSAVARSNSDRPGWRLFRNASEVDCRSKSQSSNAVLLPELALEAASNMAVADFPSPGRAEVIKITFGLALESSGLIRIACTASLKCERGSSNPLCNRRLWIVAQEFLCPDQGIMPTNRKPKECPSSLPVLTPERTYS